MKLRPLSSTFTWNRPSLLVRMVNIQGQSPSQLLPQKNFSNTSDNGRSVFQQPNVKEDDNDQTSYLLVLLTDDHHHNFMNSLRSTYFPAALNKIEAHLTLFHALPESKLQDHVIPAIEDVVKRTAPYRIKATRPFPLSKGVAIAVADDIDFPKTGDNSRNTTSEIHAQLRAKWKDWLSKQDLKGFRLHYTVMNKVDDEGTRERAFNELTESFRTHEDVSGGRFRYTDNKDEHSGTVQGSWKVPKWKPKGQVLGLTLYEYHPDGYWINPMEFRFRATTSSENLDEPK